jgi:hypothetical protein
MRLTLLALAAASAVASTPALAAGHHASMGAMVKPPAQPLPYAQLDAYLKASPKQRASKDWWAEGAPVGAAANTSATAPAIPGDTPASATPSPSMTTPNPDPAASAPTATDTPPDKASPEAMTAPEKPH